MKKFLSVLLVFILASSCMLCVSAADSMTNFKKSNTYSKPFSDVAPESWYAQNVAAAYELGLVNGKSETQFFPDGNVTIAESITLAARIHNTYCGNTVSFSQSSPWYQAYVDYAVENAIISTETFKSYDALATRAEFANIMAKALPKKEYNVINNVKRGNIPDIYAYMPCSENVYTLYNAGILSGSDELGTFYPDSNIKRCEVAAIVERIAVKDRRKEFILKAVDGARRVEKAVCVKKDTSSPVKNAYINPANGQESPFDTYCSSRDFFELETNDVVFARIKNAAIYFPGIIFYDANKKFISGEIKTVQPKDRLRYKDMEGTFYKLPENAKYMRFCYGSGFHNNNLEIYIITHTKESAKPFEGTKILNLGDSLFGNDRTYNISSYLSEYSGATVYNGGFGGTLMTSARAEKNSGYYYFDAPRIVSALCSDNWTEQDSVVNKIPTAYYPETLNMLKTLDMTKIDIVTLAWGTNDYTGEVRLSEITKSLENMIGMLKSAFPHIKIVVITPVWRYFDNGDADTIKFSDCTLKEIADGIIATADKCGVYVIDSYSSLDLRDAEHKYFDTGDNTHLNAKGNALYAQLIFDELKKIYGIE